jgi:hypothetical protein
MQAWRAWRAPGRDGTLPMNRPPDIEGLFHLLPEGGRGASVWSGYRPQHRLYGNCWTSGEHEYLDVTELTPGGIARVAVWFITPHVYPHSLWRSREIIVSEGERVVGTLKVTRVLNPILRGKAATYKPLWSAPPGLERATDAEKKDRGV